MILAIPFILLAIALAWGWFSSNVILHQLRLANDFNPKSFGFEFETFKVLTADQVELVGWFVPATKPTNACVIVAHGWGANRSDIAGASIFLANKFNLVFFDFRNHGNSGGDKTSLGCLEVKDLQAVTQYMKSQKKEFAERLGVLGYSMGGAVAITEAAENLGILAVAADSSFTSYKEVVYRYGTNFFHAPRLIIPITLFFAQSRLGFDPEDCSPIYHIAKLSPRPIFLIQGGSDDRVPVSDGEQLLAKAGEPKELWIVKEAGHNGAKESAPSEYEERVSGFFEKYLKSK